MRSPPLRVRAISCTLVLCLGMTWFLAGCGENSAKVAAQRTRERNAAIAHANHPNFPVAPCSLVSVGQVSKVLGVRASRQRARQGCIYTGKVSSTHDTRTLTVTPAAVPAGDHLISTAIHHPQTLSGTGFHAQVGGVAAPGSTQAATTAVGGVLAGNLYVALTVQDANANAPSQVNRAALIARLVGERLYRSAQS